LGEEEKNVSLVLLGKKKKLEAGEGGFELLGKER